jgi:hypothetical protein
LILIAAVVPGDPARAVAVDFACDHCGRGRPRPGVDLGFACAFFKGVILSPEVGRRTLGKYSGHPYTRQLSGQDPG